MTNHPIIVTINRIGSQGDGIAVVDGRDVLVPFTSIGDKVSMSVIGGKACNVELVEKGSHRKEPACQYFMQCGGCNSQHLSKEAYLGFKQQRLQETLARSGFEDVAVEEVVQVSPHSRRRVEFKVKVEKKEVALGFYRAATHDVIALHTCPVTSEAIIDLIDPLTLLISALKKPGNMVAVQVSQFDHGVELIFKSREPLLARDKEILAGALDLKHVTRVAVIAKNEKVPLVIKQKSVPIMRFGASDVEMPIGAFMQATAEGQAALTAAVMSVVKPSMKVADLYAGCGTYSFPMAETGATVFAYEGMDSMVMAGSNAAKKAGLHQLLFGVRDLVKHPLKASELSSMDAVVINPPRAGASKQCAEVAKAEVEHVVMVSCNPATLTHDLKHFKREGYQVEKAVAVDQFLWTGHLESVVILRRVV